MKKVEEARRRSKQGILRVREIASKVFGDDTNLIIGVNGSYARNEATSGSDIDLFYLVFANGILDQSKRLQFESEIKRAGFKLPSEGGVFEEAMCSDELLRNIGGLEDTNASLTRRLLLLLEGEWLLNEVKYLKIRNELLSKYVNEKTPKEKIALFLLNDIIRYWRTICVDYEFKTADGKKPRGIRLVKLRFSRMLLVFGGIVAVAETLDLESDKKIKRLEELLSKDVLSRVEDVMGTSAGKVKKLYEEFLVALDDELIRQKLSQADYEETQEFKNLRIIGREFKDALLEALSDTYPENHPIHKAMLL